MKRLFPVLVLLLVVVLAAGCRSNTPGTAPVVQPPIKVLAYINVSSGCQQDTVDLLTGLQQKYPRLNVEMVDFGDGGVGSERWQASGHKCMTIEIDGNSLVKFPHEGQTKAVALKMPAGFLWTHEDLEQAVAAAVKGELQPATEEEALGTVDQEKLEKEMKQYKANQSTEGDEGKQGAKVTPSAKADEKAKNAAPKAAEPVANREKVKPE